MEEGMFEAEYDRSADLSQISGECTDENFSRMEGRLEIDVRAEKRHAIVLFCFVLGVGCSLVIFIVVLSYMI